MNAALRDKLDGRLVVASVSGGKDSAAMALYLRELGVPHRRVFLDTGWENERTYEYIRGPLTDVVGEIEFVRGDLLMPDLIRSKAMFPSRQTRFCTIELKVKPMVRYLKALHADGHDTINAVGVRRAESKARSELPEWEWQDAFDCEVWRPLIDWSEQDVIDMHTKHGLRPNPLYLDGLPRVGCWPCIFAHKADIRHIAEVSPERIDEIRGLEEELTEAAEQRYAARGETFESLGYQRPAYFGRHVPGVGRRGVPIDEAVAWANTSRGGKQVEMFSALPQDAGCMRWGLCDSQPEEGNDDE